MDIIGLSPLLPLGNWCFSTGLNTLLVCSSEERATGNFHSRHAISTSWLEPINKLCLIAPATSCSARRPKSKKIFSHNKSPKDSLLIVQHAFTLFPEETNDVNWENLLRSGFFLAKVVRYIRICMYIRSFISFIALFGAKWRLLIVRLPWCFVAELPSCQGGQMSNYYQV